MSNPISRPSGSRFLPGLHKGRRQQICHTRGPTRGLLDRGVLAYRDVYCLQASHLKLL